MIRYSFTVLLAGITFFVIVSFSPLFAQPDTIFNRAGTLILQPFAEYNSAAIFYDSSGKTINRIERKFEPYGYVSDFSVYTIGFAAQYTASKTVRIHARVPFSIAQLNEDYTASNIGRVMPRRNLSTSGMQYYQVGMEYVLPIKKAMTSALMTLRTAPSFTSPVPTNDTNLLMPFMPGGTLDFTLGAQSRITFVSSDVTGKIEYHYRTGGLRDLASISLEGRIFSISDAIIRCNAQGVFTTGATQGVAGFTTQTFPAFESYLAAGAGFMLFLSDEFYVDVNYAIRVVGANTWGLGTINTTAGFILPLATQPITQ